MTIMSEQRQHLPQRSQRNQRRIDEMTRCTQNAGSSSLVNVAAFEAQTGPIFTRSLLEKAARQVELLRKGLLNVDEKNSMPQLKESIRIPHALGGGYTEPRLERAFLPKASISFINSWGMGLKDGKYSPYMIDSVNCSTSFMNLVTLTPDDGADHPLRKAAAALPQDPELDVVGNFQGMVYHSALWAKLKKRLDTLTVKVENIVCLALGDLANKGEPVRRAASSAQHLLACLIANHLATRYKRDDPSDDSHDDIPIVAFDPVYTLQTISLLGALKPPINVVTQPHQYLAITTSTLVLCINHPVFEPVLEVCADICFPLGPAAIIINEAFEYPWLKNGMAICLEMRTPRVSKMLEAYDGRWIAEEEIDYPAEMNWCDGLFCYARTE